MQRITDPTASATIVAPPSLTGTTGYFAPAVPGISAATRLRYWFMTMIQEEIMSVLAAAGGAADTTGTVFTQLLQSIQMLSGGVAHGVQAFNTPGAFSFAVPANVTQIEVELWGGGSGSWASTAPSAPTAGGVSSFGPGPYLSATGGVVNGTTTTSNPAGGNLAGVGSGGDQSFYGGDGGQGIGTQGGMGGCGPYALK